MHTRAQILLGKLYTQVVRKNRWLNWLDNNPLPLVWRKQREAFKGVRQRLSEGQDQPARMDTLEPRLLMSTTLTEGDDTYTGTPSDDTIYALGGNDVVSGWLGTDTLYGGEGDDTLHGGVYNSPGFDDDIFVGGPGNDSIYGTWGNNTYYFYKGDGHDTIYEMKADENNDRIILSGISSSEFRFVRDNYNDLIIEVGSEGTDSIRIVNWYYHGDYYGGIDYIQFNGGLWNRSQVNSQNVYWTDASDDWEGTADNNRIYAGGGNDIVSGLRGADTLYGGDGDDTLYGNAYLSPLYDDDVFIGGPGNDSMYGSYSSNTYYYRLGDGDDLIVEISSSQTSNTDRIWFQGDISLEDIAYYSGINGDQIKFKNGKSGSIRLEKYNGNGHIEKLVFNGGSQVVNLSSIPQIEVGSVSGQVFHDLDGDGNNAFGDDEPGLAGIKVFKDENFDRIHQAHEHYALTDEYGNYTLDVNTGGRRFIVVEKQQGIEVTTEPLNGNANRVIEVDMTNSVNYTNANWGMAEVIHVPTPNDDEFYLSFFDQTFDMLSGNDIVYAGGGNDDIYGNLGDDTLYGEDGNDILGGGTGSDTLSGGAGNDEIDGGSGVDYLTGGDGNDLIVGGGDRDFMDGGAGNDTMHGGVIGNMNDTSGGQYTGGAGDDTIYGTAGDDAYFYHLGDGNDVIYESGYGVNELIFGANITIFDVTATQLGNDLRLAIDGGGQVLLKDWFLESVHNYHINRFVFNGGLEPEADRSTILDLPIGNEVGVISGTVFLDDDEDGLMSEGEVGLAGISVYLSNGMATLSDENGHFAFSNVSLMAFIPQAGELAGYWSDLTHWVEVDSFSELIESSYQKPVTLSPWNRQADVDLGFVLRDDLFDYTGLKVVDDNTLYTGGHLLGEISVDSAVNAPKTYTVAGGDSNFIMNGRELRVAEGVEFDFDVTPVIDLEIQIAEPSFLHGQYISIPVQIIVNEVNVAPDDIQYTGGNTVNDNAIYTDSFLGSFEVVDDNLTDAHSLSLIGDARFELRGNELHVVGGSEFDVDDDLFFDLEVTADEIDAGHEFSYSRTIRIDVVEVPVAPVDILLDSIVIPENVPGSQVGMLSIVDDNLSEVHAVSVDDARFEVIHQGGHDWLLKLKDDVGALNYELEQSITLEVTASDSIGSVKRDFSLEVQDDTTELIRMGEVGQVSVDHTDTVVHLNGTYERPVVFAQLPSNNSLGAIVVRVTDVESDHFTVRLVESSDQDNIHGPEMVSYIVLEEGLYHLPDGRTVEVGKMQVSETHIKSIEPVEESFVDVMFRHTYANTPVVMTQVQTEFNGLDLPSERYLGTRQRAVTNSGFQVALEGEELHQSPYAPEDVAYLAIDQGRARWSGFDIEAIRGPDSNKNAFYKYDFSAPFDVLPNLWGVMQTADGRDSAQLRYTDLEFDSVKISVQEDQSSGTEVNHTHEVVGLFLIGGTGDIYNTIEEPDLAPYGLLLDSAEVDDNTLAAPVGYLTVLDDNRIDTFTFAVDHPDFVVETVGETHLLRVKDGVMLDAESESTVTLTVTVTDIDGLSHDETFAIAVNEVDVAPTHITLDTSSVSENPVDNFVANITVSDLNSTDTHLVKVTGQDQRFEVVSDGQAHVLKLKQGERFDYETEASVTVELTAIDDVGSVVSSFELAIVDDISESILMGEVGRALNVTHATKIIHLDNSYVNPVVFANLPERVGGQQVVVRVSDVQSDRFTIQVTEPSNLDASHAAEDISYIVLEAGLYRLPDGRVIEVGVKETSSRLSDGQPDDHKVELRHDFGEIPLIFTQVQTMNNGTDAANRFIGTRLDAISGTDFRLGLEGEEARVAEFTQDEQVGYLATTSGDARWSGLDFTFMTMELTNAETRHTFTPAYTQKPNLLGTIQTNNEADPAKLRYRRLNTNRVDLYIDEDNSQDSEVAHASETVAFMFIGGEGDLYNKNELSEAGPIDIQLPLTVNDNTVADVIGDITVIDPTAGDSFTISVDDPRFEVGGNGSSAPVLKLAEGVSLDHDLETEIAITLTATDAAGHGIEKTFTLQVIEVDRAATDISLDRYAVFEKRLGAEVGRISVLDPNLTDTHTISVVNDGRFVVVDDGQSILLKLAADQTLDYQVDQSIQLTLRALGSDGLAYEQDVLLEVWPTSAFSDFYAIDAGTTLLQPLAASQDDVPAFEIVAPSRNGTVRLTDPGALGYTTHFEYTPDADFVGVEAILFRAAGNEQSNVMAVYIEVGQSEVVAYLPLDELGQNQVSDELGNHHGTVSGVQLLREDGQGMVAVFDGDGHISIDPTAQIGLNEVAVREVNFKFKVDDPSQPGRQVLYHEGDQASGLVIYVEGGQLYAGGYNDEVAWSPTFISEAIQAGRWYNLSLISGGQSEPLEDGLSLWLDGGNVGTATGGKLSAYAATPAVRIGASNENGARFADAPEAISTELYAFSGRINDLMILNRELALDSGSPPLPFLPDPEVPTPGEGPAGEDDVPFLGEDEDLEDPLPQNEAPVIEAGQTFTISEYADGTEPLWADDADDGAEDGSVQVIATDDQAVDAYYILDGNPDGRFAIDSNGMLSIIKPELIDYESQDVYSLEVMAEDEDGLYSIQTATVEVTGVNEAPVLAGDYDYAMWAGKSLDITVPKSNLYDPEGDTLTYALTLVDGEPLLGEEWLFIEDEGDMLRLTTQGTDVLPNLEAIKVGQYATIRLTATDSQGLVGHSDIVIKLPDHRRIPAASDVTEHDVIFDGSEHRISLPSTFFPSTIFQDYYRTSIESISGIPGNVKDWLTFDTHTNELLVSKQFADVGSAMVYFSVYYEGTGGSGTVGHWFHLKHAGEIEGGYSNYLTEDSRIPVTPGRYFDVIVPVYFEDVIIENVSGHGVNVEAIEGEPQWRIYGKLKESLLLGSEEDGNQLLLNAYDRPENSDPITITIQNTVVSNAEIDFEVIGHDIVINLATDAGGTILSTAEDLRLAIRGSAAVNGLISVPDLPVGSGWVQLLSETELSYPEHPVVTVEVADALHDEVLVPVQFYLDTPDTYLPEELPVISVDVIDRVISPDESRVELVFKRSIEGEESLDAELSQQRTVYYTLDSGQSLLNVHQDDERWTSFYSTDAQRLLLTQPSEELPIINFTDKYQNARVEEINQYRADFGTSLFYNVVFSQDQRYAAFLGDLDRDSDTDIYRMDLQTGIYDIVNAGIPGRVLPDIYISADGNTIAFEADVTGYTDLDFSPDPQPERDEYQIFRWQSGAGAELISTFNRLGEKYLGKAPDLLGMSSDGLIYASGNDLSGSRLLTRSGKVGYRNPPYASYFFVEIGEINNAPSTEDYLEQANAMFEAYEANNDVPYSWYRQSGGTWADQNGNLDRSIDIFTYSGPGQATVVDSDDFSYVKAATDGVFYRKKVDGVWGYYKDGSLVSTEAVRGLVNSSNGQLYYAGDLDDFGYADAIFDSSGTPIFRVDPVEGQSTQIHGFDVENDGSGLIFANRGLLYFVDLTKPAQAADGVHTLDDARLIPGFDWSDYDFDGYFPAIDITFSNTAVHISSVDYEAVLVPISASVTDRLVPSVVPENNVFKVTFAAGQDEVAVSLPISIDQDTYDVPIEVVVLDDLANQQEYGNKHVEYTSRLEDGTGQLQIVSKKKLPSSERFNIYLGHDEDEWRMTRRDTYDWEIEVDYWDEDLGEEAYPTFIEVKDYLLANDEFAALFDVIVVEDGLFNIRTRVEKTINEEIFDTVTYRTSELSNDDATMISGNADLLERNIDLANLGEDKHRIHAGYVNVAADTGQANVTLPIDNAPIYVGDDNLTPYLPVSFELPDDMSRASLAGGVEVTVQMAGYVTTQTIPQASITEFGEGDRLQLIAKAHDMTERPTGSYEYLITLDFGNNKTKSFRGETEIVNRVHDTIGQSEHGDRWFVDGLDRLYFSTGYDWGLASDASADFDGDFLSREVKVSLIRGDGASALFDVTSSISQSKLGNEATLVTGTSEAGPDEDTQLVIGAGEVSWTLSALEIGKTYELLTYWNANDAFTSQATFELSNARFVGSVTDPAKLTVDQTDHLGGRLSLGFFVVTEENQDVVVKMSNADTSGNTNMYVGRLSVADNWAFTSTEGDYHSLAYNKDSGVFTLFEKFGNKSEFDFEGLLTRRLDLNENALNYAYTDKDSDGVFDEIDSIYDSIGNTVVYDYDGSQILYGHDAVDQGLWRVIDYTLGGPNGELTELKQVGEGDPTWTFTYPDGLLKTLTEPSRADGTTRPMTELDYNNGYVTKVTQAKGNVTDQIEVSIAPYYATSDGIALAASGKIGNQAHDPATEKFENFGSHTDGEGGTWTYQLNSAGQLISFATPGETETDSDGELLDGGGGYVTRWERNEDGLVTKRIDPAGSGGYRVDESAEDDPLDPFGELVTQYSYQDTNLAGSILPVIQNGKVKPYHKHPDAETLNRVTTAASYNANDQLTSTTDGEGYVTAYQYYGAPAEGETDYEGNLQSITVDGDLIAEYTYTTLTAGTGEDERTLSGLVHIATEHRDATTSYETETIYYGEDKNADGTAASEADAAHLFGLVKFVVAAKGTDEQVITYFEYDDHRNLTKEVIKDVELSGDTSQTADRETHYEYNDLDRLEVVKQGPAAGVLHDAGATADQPEVKYVYDEAGYLIYEYELIRPGGNIDTAADRRETKFVYDAIGRQTEVQLPGSTEADPVKIVTSYDNNGNVATVTDELGNVTTYDYFKRNLLKNEILPAANDVHGDLNHGQTINAFNYDSVGNLKESIAAENGVALKRTTQYVYDEIGRLIESRSPEVTNYQLFVNQAGTEFEFNELEDDQSIVHYSYDNNGNLYEVIDALGFATRYEYDALNRQTRVHQKEILRDTRLETQDFVTVAETTYDFQGNVTAIYDANLNETLYSYDGLGRLVRLTASAFDFTDDQGTTLAINPITEYRYNDAGDLLEVRELADNTPHIGIDPLPDTNVRSTRYVYDEIGRQIKIVQPDSTVVEYLYDITGNLRAAIQPDRHAEVYGYDLRDRMILSVQGKYLDSQTDNTLANHLANSDFASIISTSAIVSSSFLNSERDVNLLSPAATAAYAHAATGNGKLVSLYAYDNAGNLSSESIFTVTHDLYFDQALGLISFPLTEFVMSLNTDYSYDERNRRIKMHQWQGEKHLSTHTDSPLQSEFYHYNMVGDLVEQQIPMLSGPPETGAGSDLAVKREYDNLGRVIKEYRIYEKTADENAHLANGYIEYNYDRSGQVVKTIETLLDADTELKTAEGDTQRETMYVYDNRGRNIQIINDQYRLNDDYTVEKLNERSIYYHYDANGNKIAEAYMAGHPSASSRLKYIYGRTEYDSLNRPTMTHLPKASVIDPVTQSERVVSLKTETVYDVLGRVVKTVDAIGRTTETIYDDMNRPVIIVQPKVGGNGADSEQQPSVEYDYFADGTVKFEKVYADLSELGVDTPISQTFYEYDDHNYLSKVTHGVEYMDDGQPVPPSYEQMKYTATGVLLSSTEAGLGIDQTTYYEADALGRHTLVVDPLINANSRAWRENVYDPAGRHVVTRYASPQQSGAIKAQVRHLDAMGNVLETNTVDLSGGTVQGDPYDRMISTYDHEGKKLTYLVKDDAADDVIKYQYDLMGRIAKEYISGQLGLILPEDPGASPIQPQDTVSGANRVYDYDIAGNVTRLKNRNGESIEYSYDSYGRLAEEYGWSYDSVTNSNKRNTTTYRYDDAGRLAYIEDDFSSVIQSYDNYDRLDKRVVFLMGDRVEAVYDNSYLADGKLDHQTYLYGTVAGNGTHTKDYDYDQSQRLKNLSLVVEYPATIDKETTLSYQYVHGAESKQIISLYGGVAKSLDLEKVYYDSLNLKSKTFKDGATGTTVLKSEVAYLPDGHLSRKDYTRHATLLADTSITEKTYTYESGLETVVSKQSNGNIITDEFTIDDEGNRIQDRTITENASSTTPLPGSFNNTDHFEMLDYNRLGVYGDMDHPDGQYRYVYDQEGNVIQRVHFKGNNDVQTTWEFKYDHRNRLVMVESLESNGDTNYRVEYWYDAFDNMIARRYSDGDDAILREDIWTYDGVSRNATHQFGRKDVGSNYDDPANPFRLTNRYLYDDMTGELIYDEKFDAAGIGNVYWALTDDLGNIQGYYHFLNVYSKSSVYSADANQLITQSMGSYHDQNTGFGYQQGGLFTDPVSSRYFTEASMNSASLEKMNHYSYEAEDEGYLDKAINVVTGGAQLIAGLGLAYAGAKTSLFGGFLLFGMSADLINAGTRTLWSGEYQQTLVGGALSDAVYNDLRQGGVRQSRARFFAGIPDVVYESLGGALAARGVTAGLRGVAAATRAQQLAQKAGGAVAALGHRVGLAQPLGRLAAGYSSGVNRLSQGLTQRLGWINTSHPIGSTILSTAHSAAIGGAFGGALSGGLSAYYGGKFSDGFWRGAAYGAIGGAFDGALNPYICFVEGTPVLTEDGPRAIETLRKGDKVWSRDEKTGEMAYKTVTATHTTYPMELVKLKVAAGVLAEAVIASNGDDVDQGGVLLADAPKMLEITGTTTHPFWSVDKQAWVKMEDLKPGEKLLSEDGKILEVLGLAIEDAPKGTATYNISVEDWATYFVGDDASQTFVWVHNMGKGCAGLAEEVVGGLWDMDGLLGHRALESLKVADMHQASLALMKNPALLPEILAPDTPYIFGRDLEYLFITNANSNPISDMFTVNSARFEDVLDFKDYSGLKRLDTSLTSRIGNVNGGGAEWIGFHSKGDQLAGVPVFPNLFQGHAVLNRYGAGGTAYGWLEHAWKQSATLGNNVLVTNVRGLSSNIWRPKSIRSSFSIGSAVPIDVSLPNSSSANISSVLKNEINSYLGL